GPWPWNEDWRFGHRWPQGALHSYDHHAPRTVPYDVKYPWELSRLWFVPILLQAAALDRSAAWVALSRDILQDWERHNPLGRSVNWRPMEAATRGLSLVFALDMNRLTARDHDLERVLVRLIAQNGSYLWRTLEDTDVNGNHFAANLAGLAAMGLALRSLFPEAPKWLAFA